jgi:uncharacterized membrane protein
VILPADFALPAAPYLAALLAGTALAIAALYRRRPPVTAHTVTALTPWMAAGGTLYALYQAQIPPTAVAPLFGSPAVYVSVGILAGLVWAAVADRPGDAWSLGAAPGILGVCGGGLLVASLGWAAVGARPDGAGGAPIVSAGILLGSVLLAALAWTALERFREVAATGTVGVAAVFGHTLDGISTAVGYELLGFGEQTPLSRIIIEAGGALPTADLIGAAWLFVLVKLLLGAGIVALFEEYVREEPEEGYLLLGVIVAVGLGPGVHNLVLFAIL